MAARNKDDNYNKSRCVCSPTPEDSPLIKSAATCLGSVVSADWDNVQEI